MSRLRIDVRRLAEAHGVFPKKALGQNFLIDPNILDKIAEAATRSVDTVIEIGPGLGALTAALSNTGRSVVAIEKDARLIPILEEVFADVANVRVVAGDATQLRIDDLLDRGARHSRPAIAGNLPYSVTSPLLLNILAQREQVASATVMIQKEVADRLIASPGTKTYGSLSVLFGVYFDLEEITRVPPNCFWPRPKVMSTVIRLVPRPEPRVDIEDPAFFERVLRAAFGQRRKTLRNSLSAKFDKADIEEAALSIDLDLGRRAETLSDRDFAALASTLARACRHRGASS
jgi:16S rRNA (adenine1518-N6/adenine1519-N6)-dimethyltransferase